MILVCRFFLYFILLWSCRSRDFNKLNDVTLYSKLTCEAEFGCEGSSTILGKVTSETGKFFTSESLCRENLLVQLREKKFCNDEKYVLSSFKVAVANEKVSDQANLQDYLNPLGEYYITQRGFYSAMKPGTAIVFAVNRDYLVSVTTTSSLPKRGIYRIADTGKAEFVGEYNYSSEFERASMTFENGPLLRIPSKTKDGSQDLEYPLTTISHSHLYEDINDIDSEYLISEYQSELYEPQLDLTDKSFMAARLNKLGYRLTAAPIKTVKHTSGDVELNLSNAKGTGVKLIVYLHDYRMRLHINEDGDRLVVVTYDSFALYDISALTK